MPNPLIAQGALNRVRASVTIPNFPNLNVTASYLGSEGISLAKNGEITHQIPTLTGLVNSPVPYVPVQLTIHLVRSQNLAQSYESQMQDNSVLGDLYCTPDASSLQDISIFNGAIVSVQEQKFNGTDAGYVITIGGYQPQNNSLFNL